MGFAVAWLSFSRSLSFYICSLSILIICRFPVHISFLDNLFSFLFASSTDNKRSRTHMHTYLERISQRIKYEWIDR